MDLEKQYTDSNGIKCNILAMLRREPEWAANIFQVGERAMVALEEYQAFNSVRNDFDAYLHAMGSWALSGEPKPDKNDYIEPGYDKRAPCVR
ncbi:unnamed protein product [marine sediment metagenome]|uniref:Uncharacterized protein n=1 Tax=marine sediment metagenome TaxID=412755 RepID=X0SXL0_9ZZZZ